MNAITDAGALQDAHVHTGNIKSSVAAAFTYASDNDVYTGAGVDVLPAISLNTAD